jgi:hypothetical protein
MKSFHEFAEANTPGGVLNQRPTFNGISPDSLQELFKKTKEIGQMVREYIQYTSKNQPQLTAGLTELLRHLQNSSPIIEKINAAMKAEYKSGPWERPI